MLKFIRKGLYRQNEGICYYEKYELQNKWNYLHSDRAMINIRTGADGVEWNGGFDSSINVKGGYNVNMGSAIGAMGWAMGGVSGMRTLGAVQTAYEGVMGTLDVATNFIPGGKAFKSVSGLANFATRGKYGTSLASKVAKGKGGGASGGANKGGDE